jgi:hypothetical protein
MTTEKTLFMLNQNLRLATQPIPTTHAFQKQKGRPKAPLDSTHEVEILLDD